MAGKKDIVEQVLKLIMGGAETAAPKIRAYHASPYDFDVFKPSEFRGSTFFASTPERARRGADAGRNEMVMETATDLPPENYRTYEVEIDPTKIKGLHLTPSEIEWFGSLPQKIIGDEALEAATRAGMPHGLTWDDFYDYQPISESVFEYTKKAAPPSITYEDAYKTGRDVYRRQHSHYAPDADEKASAERMRQSGMGGYMLEDEGGTSLAVSDPEIVKILRKYASGGRAGYGPGGEIVEQALKIVMGESDNVTRLSDVKSARERDALIKQIKSTINLVKSGYFQAGRQDLINQKSLDLHKSGMLPLQQGTIVTPPSTWDMPGDWRVSGYWYDEKDPRRFGYKIQNESGQTYDAVASDPRAGLRHNNPYSFGGGFKAYAGPNASPPKPIVSPVEKPAIAPRPPEVLDAINKEYEDLFGNEDLFKPKAHGGRTGYQTKGRVVGNIVDQALKLVMGGADEIPAFKMPTIRPSTDNLMDVGSSNFDHFEFGGDKMLPIQNLVGGVNLSDPSQRKRVDALKSAISNPDTGYISRLVVDQDGNVIEGQHRLEALRESGATEVPVTILRDKTAGIDVPKIKSAITSQGSIHSDHVNQLIDMLMDADQYDPPSGFEKFWDAGLKELSSQKGRTGYGPGGVIDDIVEMAGKIVSGADEPAATGIRAYHGSPKKGLTRLSTRYAVETPNAVFAAKNPDVAHTFTIPREYGEPVYVDEFGNDIEPGEVFELNLTPKSVISVSPEEAQKFIDDTAFQTEFVKNARQKGHDLVVAPDVLEGIGERSRGDVYAVLDDRIISIIRKYGIAGASAMLGYNLMDGLDPAQARAAVAADQEYQASGQKTGGMLPPGMEPSGELTSRNPSASERLYDYVREHLLGDEDTKGSRAETVMNVLDQTPATIPLVAYDIGRSIAEAAYAKGGEVYEDDDINDALRIAKDNGGVTDSEFMSEAVKADQKERRDYSGFVNSQADGDWARGAAMYRKMYNRPADDIFNERQTINQHTVRNYDTSKFNDKDWENYWLLSQHADMYPDFQKKALENIGKYRGTDNDQYRYLSDRISCSTDGSQKYGTQQICAPRTGKSDGGGAGSVFMTDAKGIDYDAQGNIIPPETTGPNPQRSNTDMSATYRALEAANPVVKEKSDHEVWQSFAPEARAEFSQQYPSYAAEMRKQDVAASKKQVQAMPEDLRSMTHTLSPIQTSTGVGKVEMPLFGINYEFPAVEKSDYITGETYRPAESTLQSLYDFKTVPFYYFPLTAGPAAAIDVAEGVASGDPTTASLAVLFGPGGKYSKAAGIAGINYLMDPANAQAGPSKLIANAIDMAKAGIRAFHGSPHDFPPVRLIEMPDGTRLYQNMLENMDTPEGAKILKEYPLGRFDMSKIGTGEGAQAYGHGFYFAESEPVAQSYRDALSPKKVAIDGQMVDSPTFFKAARRSPSVDDNIAMLNKKRENILKDQAAYTSDSELGDFVSELYDQQLKDVDKEIAELSQHKGKWFGTRPGGSMYEVNIDADPDAFLDWDKPLRDQPQNVREALAPWGHLDAGGPVGDLLKYTMQHGADATKHLAGKGIPGIKYLDAGSRGTAATTQSHVDYLKKQLAVNEQSTLKAQANRYTPPDYLKQLEAERNDLTAQIDKLSKETSPTRNYVVFDDKLISIIRKYGIAGASVMAGYDLMKNLGPDQAKAAIAADQEYQADKKKKDRGGTVTGPPSYDNDDSVAHALALTSEY